jgi:hypothetical protein
VVEDLTLWHRFRLGDAAKASGASQGCVIERNMVFAMLREEHPCEAARCEQPLLSIQKIFRIAEDKS